jgi:hypothetical protein
MAAEALQRLAFLKRAFAFAAAFVSALILAGVAYAAYDVEYAYRYFSPGTSNNSNWDIPNNRWFCNTFQHPGDFYWSLVTFIDNTGYNWHYTNEGNGDVVQTCIGVQESMFTKLCHCKNTSSTGYWGSCVGRRNAF